MTCTRCDACESAPCNGRALGCWINTTDIPAVNIPKVVCYGPSLNPGQKKLQSMIRPGTPCVGDYVGRHANTGDWMFICALNWTTREVKVGAAGTCGGGWLSEAAAQALYSYSWGAKKAMPGPATVASWFRLPKHQVWPGYDLDSIPPTLPSVHTSRCECGSGSDELSGAHSHWCPRWLAPERGQP